MVNRINNLLRRLIKDIIVNKYSKKWEIYKDYILIGNTTIIDNSASLKIYNLSSKEFINLEIGYGSHIFSSFNILKESAKIVIGNNCQLGAVNFICAENIIVGNDVLMAWGITIMDNDSHSIEWENRRNDIKQCYEDYLLDKNNFIKNKDWTNVKTKKIIIEDKVWIGFNSTVLKGVSIGEGAVIGANSVVVSNIPAWTVAAGNPARVIRKIK